MAKQYMSEHEVFLATAKLWTENFASGCAPSLGPRYASSSRSPIGPNQRDGANEPLWTMQGKRRREGEPAYGNGFPGVAGQGSAQNRKWRRERGPGAAFRSLERSASAQSGLTRQEQCSNSRRRIAGGSGLAAANRCVRRNEQRLPLSRTQIAGRHPTHNDLIMNSPPRYIRSKVAARARTAVFSFRSCSRTRGGGTATVVRGVAARRA